MAGVNATETGNEVSQPTLEFAPMFIRLIRNPHNTEMCKFMGKELLENAPAPIGSEKAGFTQFLAHKSTLLSSFFSGSTFYYTVY